MNFLADESIDRQIVDRLRQDGHDVIYVAELSPSASDEIVLKQANQQEAILITADKDFGELVYRLGRIHAGVVLLRLAGCLPARKAQIASAAIQGHLSDLLDSFSVISHGTVRIRHRM